jgi:hypothetical protein
MDSVVFWVVQRIPTSRRYNKQGHTFHSHSSQNLKFNKTAIFGVITCCFVGGYHVYDEHKYNASIITVEVRRFRKGSFT